MKPEQVLTTSGGLLVTETLMETFTDYTSSSIPTSNEAIVSITTSAIAKSSVPVATPSQAMIIYRRDVCVRNHGDTECSSTAFEYDITPGQSVETCEGKANYQAPTYQQVYPHYEGGVTSNYAINIGPFVTHGFRDCSYNGTYQAVGKLNCPLFEASCSVPTATAEICDLATDTPVVYAEW